MNRETRPSKELTKIISDMEAKHGKYDFFFNKIILLSLRQGVLLMGKLLNPILFSNRDSIFILLNLSQVVVLKALGIK